MELKFKSSDDPQVHDCHVERVGDWVIYTCPHCPEYRRRYNYRTGEMQVEPCSDPNIRHRGSAVEGRALLRPAWN